MTVTVTAGFGATGDTGFDGLVMFVGFVGLRTHVLVVVDHALHVGTLYGVPHDDTRVCVIDPIYPVWHDNVCV